MTYPELSSPSQDGLVQGDLDAGVLIRRSSHAAIMAESESFDVESKYSWPSSQVRAFDADLPFLWLAWQGRGLHLAFDFSHLSFLEIWFHLCSEEVVGEKLHGYAYGVRLESSPSGLCASWSGLPPAALRAQGSQLPLQQLKGQQVALFLEGIAPGFDIQTHRTWRVALQWKRKSEKETHYWPLHSQSILESSSLYWARLYWQEHHQEHKAQS